MPRRARCCWTCAHRRSTPAATFPEAETCRCKRWTALPDRTVPLFVYCRSGSRSGQAVALLKQKGYHNVRNIGGILSYRGPLETS